MFTQSRIPNPKNSPQIIDRFISSRGIGLGFIIISMVFEILSDLITIFDKDNNNINTIPKLGLFQLVLWNFSLATKSIAMFIAMSRSSSLTTSLSKEPIISHHIYNFSIYFNLINGIMVYPSLVCVLVLYKTIWNRSLMMTSFYYIFQMILCLIFFLTLNKRMKVAMEQGLLIDIDAMKKFRKFCLKTSFMIGFLICEILSLLIFNLDQLIGDLIQKSFFGTTFIFGFITQSSSAVYAITVIILCTHFSNSSIQPDNNPINGQNHILSDFTNITLDDAENKGFRRNHSRSQGTGFTTIRLQNVFKKHNRSSNLSFLKSPKNDKNDVELGEEKKHEEDIIVNEMVAQKL